MIAQHKREEARRYLYLQAAGPAPDLPDITERVLATVTAHSMRSRLVSALARLSAGDRDVLLLIAWEQLSYEEVARALAIPVGTVRSGCTGPGPNSADLSPTPTRS